MSQVLRTLILYKRHTRNCAIHKSRIPKKNRQYWMECDCPIWIRGRTPSGDIVPMQSTRSTDLKQAEALRASLMAKTGSDANAGPSIAECIEKYLASREQELDPRTLSQHRLALGRLKRYLESEGVRYIREMTVDHLETFKTAGLPKDMERTTKSTAFAKIRCFLRAAFRRGWIKEYLVERVTTVKAVYEQKEPYSDEEVTAILDGALQLDGGTHGYAAKPATFRLLLELMLETGLRVGDAVSFDPRSLDRGDNLWIYTYRPRKQKKTRALIAAEYAVAATAAISGVLLDLQSLPIWAETSRIDPGTVSDALLAAAGLCAAAIFRFAPRPGETPFRRRQRRWYIVLVCALEAGFVLQLAWPQWFGQALRFLPFAFMLVTVYYGERLAFWDVFAKRGLFFFLALVTLTAHFALLGPYLDLTILGLAKAWTIALSILPWVAAAPWFYSRLNLWVDRVWLGRPFSPMEAVRHFSEDVQGAISEDDLIERAESSLREIFRSKACVDREPIDLVPDELSAPLRVHGSDWGLVHILPRTGEIPFLSQEAELLQVLARSLGSMIESEELRSQRLLQQQRERELALNAARSELKALRAQINPYFLFNALNTIASLIPRQPAQAEQTVEQLSEVFRYTVHHTEREWVRVADEIDFVRPYLDIEQARFGKRLRVSLDVDSAASEVRIPAMIIQTLAENAIKHGVAAVRGPGRIAISACVENSTLRVAVEDSGPGFPVEVRPDALPEPSRGGYGLRNVRERLKAYYGFAGRVAFGRSPAGMTRVAIELPISDGGHA